MYFIFFHNFSLTCDNDKIIQEEEMTCPTSSSKICLVSRKTATKRQEREKIKLDNLDITPARYTKNSIYCWAVKLSLRRRVKIDGKLDSFGRNYTNSEFNVAETKSSICPV